MPRRSAVGELGPSLLDLLCCGLGAAILLLLFFVAPQAAVLQSPREQSLTVSLRAIPPVDGTNNPKRIRLGVAYRAAGEAWIANEHLNESSVGIDVFPGDEDLTLRIPLDRISDESDLAVFIREFPSDAPIAFAGQIPVEVTTAGGAGGKHFSTTVPLSPKESWARTTDLKSLATKGGQWEAAPAASDAEPKGPRPLRPPLPHVPDWLVGDLNNSRQHFQVGGSTNHSSDANMLLAAIANSQDSDPLSYAFGLVQARKMSCKGSESWDIGQDPARYMATGKPSEAAIGTEFWLWPKNRVCDNSSLPQPISFNIIDERLQELVEALLVTVFRGTDDSTISEHHIQAKKSEPLRMWPYIPTSTANVVHEDMDTAHHVWHDLMGFYHNIADGGHGGTPLVYHFGDVVMLVDRGKHASAGDATVLIFHDITAGDVATIEHVLIEPGSLDVLTGLPNDGTLGSFLDDQTLSPQSMLGIDRSGVLVRNGTEGEATRFTFSDRRSLSTSVPTLIRPTPDFAWATRARHGLTLRNDSAPRAFQLLALGYWSDEQLEQNGVGAEQHPWLWLTDEEAANTNAQPETTE